MELKGRRLFIYMTIATLAITLLFLLILIAGKNKTKQMPFTESGPQKTATQIPEQYLNPTADLLETGRQVYIQNCSSCHGDSGRGDGPDGEQFNPRPRNFVSDSLKLGFQPAELYHTVTAGITGTMMASFQFLSERDRWAVVHYLRTFRPNQSVKSDKN
jgi:mono/diheme cytochrome c family protein